MVSRHGVGALFYHHICMDTGILTTFQSRRGLCASSTHFGYDIAILGSCSICMKHDYWKFVTI